MNFSKPRGVFHFLLGADACQVPLAGRLRIRVRPWFIFAFALAIVPSFAQGQETASDLFSSIHYGTEGYGVKIGAAFVKLSHWIGQVEGDALIAESRSADGRAIGRVVGRYDERNRLVKTLVVDRTLSVGGKELFHLDVEPPIVVAGAIVQLYADDKPDKDEKPGYWIKRWDA